MKITLNWLREHIDCSWDAHELAERLTRSGLEREVLEDISERYRGVVVGEIINCSAHPRADKLSVCKVNIGNAKCSTIVCGAPNVTQGQKVVVILPDHSLPDGTDIKNTHIRGIESEGMLCSEAELDLGTNNDGIIVLPKHFTAGTPYAKAVGLDDKLIEFEVTPNRPDCLSVFGIAREVRALTGQPLKILDNTPPELGNRVETFAKIEIEDPIGCPRYVGRVIHGVEVGPSPQWLKHRLQTVGLRPINNVVDVTNYIMLELGQPLHAFDLEKISNHKLIVRRAQEGESLKLLDGTECNLNTDTLIIADDQKPIALAGIMGGRQTEVSESSVDIFLESAYFSTDSIRASTHHFSLSTEASARFERGTDWDLPPIACDRAANLLAKITGGIVASGKIDVYPSILERPIVELRIDKLNQLLATQLKLNDASHILELLGCDVVLGDNNLTVTIPSFRPDLEREIDLIEEVGRIYGYDHIEEDSNIRGPVPNTPTWGNYDIQQIIKRRMIAAGADEVVTSSIIDGDWISSFPELPSAPPLTNPANASDVLRSSLLPSLADVARRNFNRRTDTICVFELGKCFIDDPRDSDPKETLHLAGLWYGFASRSLWRSERRAVEFLDVKGLIESVVEDIDLEFKPGNHHLMRAGHCAEMSYSDEKVGHVGECSQKLRTEFDLPSSVYIFELDFEVLSHGYRERDIEIQVPPKFPPIERDIAIVLEKSISAGNVGASILEVEPAIIRSVELFDVYVGNQVPEGQKSLAFSIVLQSTERTLQDSDADKVIERVLAKLQQSFNANLR